MNEHALDNTLKVAVLMNDVDLWEAAKIMEALHREFNDFAAELVELVFSSDRPELVEMAHNTAKHAKKPLLVSGKLEELKLGSLHLIINLTVPGWIGNFASGVLSSLSADFITAMYYMARHGRSQRDSDSVHHPNTNFEPRVYEILGQRSWKRLVKKLKGILPEEKASDLKIVYEYTSEVIRGNEVYRQVEKVECSVKND